MCPAQSVPKLWRVGYLSPYPSPDDARFEAFREKLRDLGHVEGKTIALEYVSAEGKPDRLPALAAELARRKVDIVLAAGGTPATRAASNVTNTIPIVFAGLADPVGQGFVKTLARPGGNLTGTTTQSPEVAVKALAFFNETLPGAKHVAILSNPTNSWHAGVLSEIHSAAAKMNVSVTVVHAKAVAEFETAFAQIMRHRPGGLLIFGDVLFNNEAKALTTLAATHRLPTIGMNNFVPDSGGLMSYGANRLDIVRRAAILVDKIIKGAKPADLPVEQPTQFELIVNTNAAKALGIALPQSILVRADRRIE
jgi:putative ABC transport system substrate-binding protein